MMIWLAVAGTGAAILLATWVIYPGVTIRIGSRRRPDSSAAVHPAPDLVSVVLATREPPLAVAQRLDDLLAGEWPPDRLEIIVAVDGDAAPYQSIAPLRAPRRLRIVSRYEATGKAAALNIGVAEASGQVLVFTDTAQRFAADAIPRLVRALTASSYAAVSGALRIGNEHTGGGPLARYWRLERRLREAEARIHSAVGVSGSIYAMWREHWTPLPAGLILDDLWIPMRLIIGGHRVGFDAEAVALDTRVTAPRQEYRRKVRTLTGNLQLVRWMPAVLLPWRNPVWMQFYFHKLFRLATPWALALVVIGVAGAGRALWPLTTAWLAAIGAAAIVGAAVLPGRLGRRTRGLVRWGLAMQAAVVAATWNGMRGRWNVWN